MERQVAGGIVIVAFVAALAAAGITVWMQKGPEQATADAQLADTLAARVGKGADAQPLLDAFVEAGAIRAATVYGANGATEARSGVPSREVEQIFRSLPEGRSLSVQPNASAAGTSKRELLATAGIAAASAAVIAMLAAWVLVRVIDRRITRIRIRVEESMRDQTWATRLQDEAGALQPLAGSINQMLEQMQKRDVVLRRKTVELENANKELESFATTVSHDLRAPVGSIAGFAQALDEDYAAQLDDTGRECIHWIRHSATHMATLIEGMLQMAKLARAEVNRTDVDLSRIAHEIAESLQRAHPDRAVEFVIPDNIIASGDERLLRAVLDNLIGNAFKFTSKRPGARIELGVRSEEGMPAFYIRDNGAGFAPEHAAKMFRPFQRLHSEREFSGTGIGLATVHRIVQRHGGRVWAEGEVEKGATVYFTTGVPEEWAA
ncbi:MAG TPA: ATP-binding protein [Thermoanaerobaculia bacterium]|jgi:signal transduction histidine kinase|nr:ATP-binding protein [Thermoanaerobaculia bacterium]